METGTKVALWVGGIAVLGGLGYVIYKVANPKKTTTPPTGGTRPPTGGGGTPPTGGGNQGGGGGGLNINATVDVNDILGTIGGWFGGGKKEKSSEDTYWEDYCSSNAGLVDFENCG